MPEILHPRRITVAAVPAAVLEGWRNLRRCLLPAMTYAAVFALIGLMIFALLLHFSLAAMILPFAGGFLLVGPVVLAGFFGLRRALVAGRQPGMQDVLQAFRQAPRGLLVISLVCVLLLLIWLTDAATVYSFMIGGAGQDALLPPGTLRFHFFTSVMGAVLALIVFCISAFSVPLLFDRRATLVGAVAGSVRAVFTNIAALLVWALILALGVMATILFPPLLVLSLPCLAFASDLLYLEIFPPDDGLSMTDPQQER